MKAQSMYAHELQLGDVVRLCDHEVNPYSDATVIRIEATEVHLARPYFVRQTWSLNGKIPLQTGSELFSIPLVSSWTYAVIQRNPVDLED